MAKVSGKRKSSKFSLLVFDMRLAAVEEEIRALRKETEKLHAAAVREGFRQLERGEGIPIREFDAKMRKKYNIPQRRRG